MSDPAVEFDAVTKDYPGVRALDGVTLTVAEGETMTLAGQNGAGKSTLMKLLTGQVQPDAGRLRLHGRDVMFDTPAAAKAAGIALVPQEINVCEHMTVCENVLLGRETRRVPSRRGERREVERLMNQSGFDLDPQATVGALSVAQKRTVEILRALAADAHVFVLDEPTASLPRDEADAVRAVVRRLQGDRKALLYVSHDLTDVLALGSRVAVLREGALAGVHEVSAIDAATLAHEMLGRPPDAEFPPRGRIRGPVVLETRGLTRRGTVEDVDLTVRKGEVVGLAGLMGSGRTELARLLAGVDRPSAGTVAVDGRPLRLRSPADAVDAGIVLVPEDRKREGVLLGKSIAWNLSMCGLADVSPRHVVDTRSERRQAQELIDRLSIRAPGPSTRVGALSGGNQQKVAIAKWLTRPRSVIILDEPTRGIDIGGKVEVFGLIEDLAAQGLGVLLISSEVSELIGMCDRVLILERGRLTRCLGPDELDEATLLAAINGVAAHGEVAA